MNYSGSSSNAMALLACLLPVLLVGVPGYRFYQAHSELEAQVATRAEAERLSADIRRLRAKPSQVRQRSKSERALARAIEQNAASAGIDDSHLTLIEPRSPQRVGETQYTEHATTVQFTGVTLPQLAQLSSALRSGSDSIDGIRVTAVRISTPYGDEAAGDETWNAELTLTYLVYSPKSPSAARG